MNRVLLEQAEKDRETIVVLYHLPDNIGTPYVTWLARKDNPEATFVGHYFPTLEEAEEDFDRRSFKGEIGLYDVMEALEVAPKDRSGILREFRGF